MAAGCSPCSRAAPQPARADRSGPGPYPPPRVARRFTHRAGASAGGPPDAAASPHAPRQALLALQQAPAQQAGARPPLNAERGAPSPLRRVRDSVSLALPNRAVCVAYARSSEAARLGLPAGARSFVECLYGWACVRALRIKGIEDRAAPAAPAERQEHQMRNTTVPARRSPWTYTCTHRCGTPQQIWPIPEQNKYSRQKRRPCPAGVPLHRDGSWRIHVLGDAPLPLA